jgi:hypothetical protein
MRSNCDQLLLLHWYFSLCALADNDNYVRGGWIHTPYNSINWIFFLFYNYSLVHCFIQNIFWEVNEGFTLLTSKLCFNQNCFMRDERNVKRTKKLIFIRFAS